MRPIDRDPTIRAPRRSPDDNLLPNGQVGVVTPAMVDAAGHPGRPFPGTQAPPPLRPPPPPGVLDDMRGAERSLLGMQFQPTDTSKMDQMYGQTMSTFDQQVADARARAASDPARQNMLLLAQGQGPAADAARAQLRAGIDASNAQAMSMAASARGGAGSRALASRAAMQQAALNNQSGANQAAAMRAQMSMQGIQGLAGLRRDDMAFDQGVATARGSMGTQMGDTYGRVGMADSANKAQFDLGKYGTAMGSMADRGSLILGGRAEDARMRELDLKEVAGGNDAANRAAGETAGQVSAITDSFGRGFGSGKMPWEK